MITKLPIVLKPHITSECWTCYKFAVMQTSKFYTDWLMSHMELVTFSTGHSTFGYNERVYNLSYFNEILNIEDGNLLEIYPEIIIDFIKKQIMDKKYVIIDLEINTLFKVKNNDANIHETLIYGYNDEEKVFYSLSITHLGTFESKLSFESVKESYSYVYDYYKKNKNHFFDRRNYFAGISLISLKDFYYNSNKEYDFFKKLHRTLDKSAYKKIIFGSDYTVSEYTMGIYRYRYLAELLSTHLKDDQHESQTLIAVLKVYEYHTLTLAALSSIVDENSDVVKKYTIHKNNYYNIFQRFLKYTFTHNKQALEKIIFEIRNLESEEEHLIIECRRFVQGTFINKIYNE